MHKWKKGAPEFISNDERHNDPLTVDHSRSLIMLKITNISFHKMLFGSYL